MTASLVANNVCITISDREDMKIYALFQATVAAVLGSFNLGNGIINGAAQHLLDYAICA